MGLEKKRRNILLLDSEEQLATKKVVKHDCYYVPTLNFNLKYTYIRNVSVIFNAGMQEKFIRSEAVNQLTIIFRESFIIYDVLIPKVVCVRFPINTSIC